MKAFASLHDWTLDELVGELRHRARKRAATGRTGRAGRIGLHEKLRTVPTALLIRAARGRQRVIYGTDNRRDVYQVKQARVLRAADAVVALVKASDLRRQADGTYKLRTTRFSDEYHLCGSEPFVSQPLGCFCSGYLVAPDVVATAGHCVKSAAELPGVRFVFGFRMLNGTTARTIFPAADVYSGVALLGRQQMEAGPDWALVRLDRLVGNRQPVAIRTGGKVPDRQSMFVIGHPCGLPAKFADGARVRDNTPAGFFAANLDTYGGNSGSPVFNRRTYQVEGTLVRGEADFVSRDGCNVSLVCPSTGCRGEDVTRTTVWANKLPKRTGRAR